MSLWITRWTGSNHSKAAGIYVDQQHNLLYVADFSNHRIQEFNLSGNGSGITVAGGNGYGSATNQLYNPLDVCVSQLNGAVYVANYSNNRVQRWNINATQGTIEFFALLYLNNTEKKARSFLYQLLFIIVVVFVQYSLTLH
jgi:DNA-binding beta-propeller fold protein YncE